MRRATAAMVVLIVANFMDLMDTTVVNVALPAIQADLDASPAAVEWIVAAYTLGLAGALITGGRLGDIVGIRRVFLIGVAGFTLASATAAVAGSADLLVVARAVQGAFAGLMVPQVLAGVQALYPPERRAPVYGLVGFITGTASVVGPVLSGVLVSTDAFGLGWRAIFAINLPIGIGLIIAAARLVPSARSDAPTRLDLVGVLLATAGVLGLVFGLIEGREHQWPWWAGMSLAAGPLLLLAFAAWQRRVERRRGTPLIPLRLFADQGYRLGSVINFSFQAGLVGFFLILTVYLQQVLEFSALRAGLVWLGLSVGALAGSVLAPSLATRFGRRVMAVGAVLFASSMIMVANAAADSTPGPPPPWWSLAGLLVFGGLGMGLIIVAVFDVALRTIPALDAGSASGALGTIQQIGGSLGIAVIGGIFYSAAGVAGTVAGHGLRAATWGSVAALLLVTGAALWPTMRERAGDDADVDRSLAER